MRTHQLRKRHLSVFFAIVFIFMTLYPLGAGSYAEETEGLELLQEMVTSLAKGRIGKIGVAVKHLESGQGFLVYGEETFPLASVVKIPIVIEVMAQVLEGKLRLQDEHPVAPGDQFFEGGMLSDLKAPGVVLSVENLIRMMMIWSDNTAADILIKKVGIENIEKRMRSFGLQDIFVNRTIKQLLVEYFGMDYSRTKELAPQDFAAAYKRFLEENAAASVEAGERYSRVRKDQATPRAINALLEALFQEKILDPASCRLILAVMTECQTGVGRIRGLLPATVVAHKTGTVGGTVNDCGIITLPGSMGHVALSILSKDTDPEETESQISLIARCVYDFFCFSRPMVSGR